MKKVTAIMVFICFVVTAAFSNIDIDKKKIDFILSQLENKYNVSLVYDSIPDASWKEVTYNKVSEESHYRQLLWFVNIFTEEFQKYPTYLVKKSKIKHIAFVRLLCIGKQHRCSLPDYRNEILFFDIVTGINDSLWIGKVSESYIRHFIHHEFYHMLEEEINGDVYYRDSIWMSYNDTAFHYGEGGASEYPDLNKQRNKLRNTIGRKNYKINYPYKGFITTYSASAPEEDKSEIFAILFNPKEMKLLNEFIKGDPILEKKVSYLKNFLETLCKEMDESYWNSLN